MQNDLEEALIQHYIAIIQMLAIAMPCGDAAEYVIQKIVNEACDLFSKVNSNNYTTNLLALRGELQLLAHVVHASCANSKKTIEYAAAQVIVS
ncbi:hypothetical protein [Collimonas sp.]|uniref:hypothetical protein n=1 Tax=Collimonas sp. TaxID=1963772 RepID=UPI002C26CD8F|nr:hypothetical protein [Collimonas sp.]HWX02379.1 hypothetical protein [Collimonas sp.]